MFTRILLLTVCGLGLLVLDAEAQLSHEAGAASVAGTLQKPLDASDEYEFDSRGNQVLFVDLDADIYINREPHDNHDTTATETMAGGGCSTTHDDAEEGGGCGSSHDEGGEDGGCAGGGKGRFLLEVLTMDQVRVCQAGKPARPGWDTDPRLACLLSEPGVYLLKVTLVGMGGHTESADGGGQVHPYLLNVSLRDLAPDFSGMKLDKAIKESVNRLPFKK